MKKISIRNTVINDTFIRETQFVAYRSTKIDTRKVQKLNLILWSYIYGYQSPKNYKNGIYFCDLIFVAIN